MAGESSAQQCNIQDIARVVVEILIACHQDHHLNNNPTSFNSKL